MAGIGFELKKLFNKRTLTGQAMAYGYSAVITCGPFALLTGMVLSIQLMFMYYGVALYDSQLYTASVIYPFVFSQIVSCGFVMVITRYLADNLYSNDYSHITSSMYGVLAITEVFAAVMAVLFFWGKPIPWYLKLFTYIFYMEMIAVWIQGVYLTALKDYKSIFVSYGTGVIVSLLLTLIVLKTGIMEPVAGALLAMDIGTALIVLTFLIQISKYFGYPVKGMNFAFLSYFEQHKRLFFVAMSYTVGIYLANFIMWQGPLGVTVADTYLYAPEYDVVTFYAFLSIMPVMIMFVVSMELHFYEHYAIYFTYITQRGNYKEIDDARKDLIHVLWTELRNIMEFQLVFSLIFMSLGNYFLSWGGIPYNSVDIYCMLVLGAFFNGIMQIVYTLLLYFEDQHGALIVTGSFFILNLVLGVAGLRIGELSYGCTFFLAAMISCGIAIWRLNHFCDRINYYIFCARPVFYQPPDGPLTKIAKRLYGKRLALIDGAVTDEEDKGEGK